MVDLEGGVAVVHLNVDSGYLTCLKSKDESKPPKIKNVILEKHLVRPHGGGA